VTKTCDYCQEIFKDGEIVYAVCPVKYKQIPSRVVYSLSTPREVKEIYHPGCFIDAFGDLGDD
jgi:hypothetical protein